MAAWWEEVFSTLLSATRYLQCQPELWVATYEGILWPKLGSGAGAVTQSSVLGLWMCSCNFSAVAPTQESWAAPGLQGPSSFPFLDCVIFPPLQWFRREGLIFPENYSHYVAIRSDHSLWGSSRWTLPAHAPPKRASHHSSLSFFFRLVLIVSQPFQDSEKKEKTVFLIETDCTSVCFFFLQAPYGWPCFCVCSRLLQAVSSVPTTLWQRVPEVVQRYQSCESLILEQARSDMTLPVPVLVENKSSSREQSNTNARWLGCWLLFWFSCSKWSPEMEPPHKGWNFSCCARLHDLCASHLALQFSVARRSFPSYLWKRSYLFFVYI